MAYTERLVRYSYQAGDTLVKWVGVPGMPGSIDPNIGNQYKIVKFGTQLGQQDVAELATSATDKFIGVTTTKPQHKATAVAVAVSGVVPVQAAAPLAYLDRVTSDGTGRAIKATAPDQGIGFVVTPASAAGTLASVQLELGR
jgi:Uncharacterized conserved protein (DUF2190)